MDNLKLSDEASALVDIWQELPREEGHYCPRKENFSPVKLGKYLRTVTLLEYVNDETVLARVAGTSLREYLGVEVTGQNVLDIYPEPFRQALKEHYHNMLTIPCAGIIERPYKNSNNVTQILKTFQLPLLGLDNKPKYLVGVVKSAPVPASKAHIKTLEWNLNDMTTCYADIGCGTPSLASTEA